MLANVLLHKTLDFLCSKNIVYSELKLDLWKDECEISFYYRLNTVYDQYLYFGPTVW